MGAIQTFPADIILTPLSFRKSILGLTSMTNGTFTLGLKVVSTTQDPVD